MIAFLQFLLMRSQKNNGLIFAHDLDQLPLETKRLEPYYQLSKPGGSLGKDSILLHYPFDFIASVPIAAIKNR
ncbi:hypothetical protein W97_02277 [Coniosporium apollinis CBS 100218]|uniref:Uncharacterized protein n=1 Tax=Coniosporium apollinis (strain CBS 100218) TaxID=1168221 RepID=R7YMB4_CONA1|nr:uncharacterized protein W97_02277 [Coniosporium apollinis CBS 100218]EON63050.1 hypothetical protein W97_02277 [Coniosporium apollinis CBS 100218]